MARRPSKLSGLQADPENPREISDRSATGLQRSLSEFGDLSGIVFNVRTGELVAGHQRVTQLRHRHGDVAIKRGKIETPDGHVFGVRFVDWPRSKQRAASLAANSQALSGTFTAAVDTWLDELKMETELYDGLLFNELRQQQTDDQFEAASIEDQGRLDEKQKTTCPQCGAQF